MSLLRLSRILLALGAASFVALLASSIFLLNRLQTEQEHLALLLAIQRDIGAISVGADAIALSGADPKLYDAYIASARRVQAQLLELGTEFPDARNAARAIDMMLADLDQLVSRDRAADRNRFSDESDKGYFADLAESNVASHGIAMDAAVSGALKHRQEQIADRAFGVAVSFASVASLFLFFAVGSFALIYQRIGGPLRAFARTIEAVDRGQADALAPDTGRDEIGEAGRAFNALVERRRAAETELERAASLLRTAGELARFGGWRYDAIKHEVEWSDETAIIHGEPPGTQPSLEDGLNYYIEEDRPRIEGAFGACLEKGTPFDDTFRIRTAKGEVIWIRSTGQPVHDADGTIIGVHGAFQDVTDLVEARNEAERRDAELRDVISSIGDGFMIVGRDWRLRYLNQTALELTGRSGRDLIGLNLWDEFPGAVGTQFGSQYRAVLETGQSRSFVEYFPPLGKWFQVSAHATRDGLALYFRDHTDEFERQSQLRLLQVATDRINDIILITEADPFSGPGHPRIIYVNATFEQRTGYTREEALASTPRILQGPDTQPEELERIRAALKAWEPVRAELINYTKSGDPYWTELDISPVTDDTGRPTHFISVQRDITERKEIERQLRESQKMEVIGQLTGGVSHDFNNLLTVILGNAELLAEQLGDRPQQRELAEQVVGAAQRGSELTSRLLAFARKQALDPVVTDLNQAVWSIMPLLRRSLGEDVDLQAGLAEDLRLVEIDPGQFETALLNLALNARDAMPEGGRLTIETGNVRIDAETARIIGIEAGRFVVVAVSDTGAGMAPEVVEQVLEPFFTTKGQGSGLGLPMVYGFSRQSGGHLKIYSEAGEGTTIKLYFPRAEADTIEAPKEEARIATPRGRGEHILVVEDDPFVRQYVIAMIQSLGYRVTEAEDAAQALEALATAGDIDLLFTDIVMPGDMNGRELAEAATGLHPGLRVIYTSGYTENAIVHQGRLEPGVELLSKPYLRQDLALKLRAVLDRPADGL